MEECEDDLEGGMIEMKMVICSEKDSCFNRENCGHAKPHEERGSCHALHCDYAGIAATCKPAYVD